MAKATIGANGVLKLLSRSEEGLEESEVKLSNFATWLKSIQYPIPAQFIWQAEPVTLSNLDWPWGRHETHLLRKLTGAAPVSGATTTRQTQLPPLPISKLSTG
ncbi:hypothetical protein [Nitrosospira multiformis]|uniref:Uncharacterized protein n=1 Tax=Nitrosospira multiformis TaxID=1231 RepID=A0A1I7HAR4_9PROT|nr:hypothetical protein [Nitrosospira multiformis]SFU57778.1 hypothetical protein SAMN05216417_1087 [Nitrosospira multiformis]